MFVIAACADDLRRLEYLLWHPWLQAWDLIAMPAIYHMTHVKNLPGILAEGGIWCDRKAAARSHCRQSIAHAHIKERRAARDVTAGRGGTLADYVPFYFATRQPMLYAIKGGRVAGYDGGQESVVYLKFSTERIARAKPQLGYVFSNGHAEMRLAEFSDDLQLLTTMVDWPLMQEVYWNDTADDPNRKFRRQAEFLVHDFMPWGLTEEIGVYSDPVRAGVAAIIASHAHRPPVTVHRGWYF